MCVCVCVCVSMCVCKCHVHVHANFHVIATSFLEVDLALGPQAWETRSATEGLVGENWGTQETANSHEGAHHLWGHRKEMQ
jgi:hypothetical protein